MGIVWEAYHKGVPLLGVPGITLDMRGSHASRFSSFFSTSLNLVNGWVWAQSDFHIKSSSKGTGTFV